MPEKETLERAHEDKRQGKAPSTQAGEFVREEIRHIRQGKHGARSTKQAIAIGLSKARRAGVDLLRRRGGARGNPHDGAPLAITGEGTEARQNAGPQNGPAPRRKLCGAKGENLLQERRWPGRPERLPGEDPNRNVPPPRGRRRARAGQHEGAGIQGATDAPASAVHVPGPELVMALAWDRAGAGVIPK